MINWDLLENTFNRSLGQKRTYWSPHYEVKVILEIVSNHLHFSNIVTNNDNFYFSLGHSSTTRYYLICLLCKMGIGICMAGLSIPGTNKKKKIENKIPKDCDLKIETWSDIGY